MTAAEEWRAELEAWVLPQHLLDAHPEDPYQSTPVLWRRARREDVRRGEDETRVLLSRLLGESGSLLDVGAGTGRVSLRFAVAGHPVTAVEADPAMAEGFRAEMLELGAEARLVEGAWPEAAGLVERHDVAVSANVVYDVLEPGPFLEALHDRAVLAVVVELTATHPWAHLSGYYRELHGLDRPAGPTDGLFVEVVRETLGVDPQLIRWRRRGVHRFSDHQELLAYYGRRLRVPAGDTDRLFGVLAEDIVEEGGWLFMGPPDRDTVTMWWPSS